MTRSARRGVATKKAAERNLAKARKKTSLGSLSKFAEHVEGGYRIKQQPPVIVSPPDAMRAAADAVVLEGLSDYATTLTPDRRAVLQKRGIDLIAVDLTGTAAAAGLRPGPRHRAAARGGNRGGGAVGDPMLGGAALQRGVVAERHGAVGTGAGKEEARGAEAGWEAATTRRRTLTNRPLLHDPG